MKGTDGLESSVEKSSYPGSTWLYSPNSRPWLSQNGSVPQCKIISVPIRMQYVEKRFPYTIIEYSNNFVFLILKNIIYIYIYHIYLSYLILLYIGTTRLNARTHSYLTRTVPVENGKYSCIIIYCSDDVCPNIVLPSGGYVIVRAAASDNTDDYRAVRCVAPPLESSDRCSGVFLHWTC